MIDLIIGGGTYDPNKPHDPVRPPVVVVNPQLELVNQAIHNLGLNLKTNKYQITVKQTIKIREIFSKVYMKAGYPVKAYHGLTFFSGMAMWIPQVSELDIIATTTLWRTQPTKMWRRMILVQKLSNLSPAIPEWLDFLMQLFSGGKTADVNQHLQNSNPDALAQSGEVDIYPYLAFKNTMNDVIITANWDYVRNELNERGY